MTGHSLPERIMTPFTDVYIVHPAAMDQFCISYASVTSHSRARYGLFPGCSRAVLNINRTSTHGPRAAPYECCLSVRGPYSFTACIISLWAPYGFRGRKQPVNSPCGDRKGPIRAPYGQIRSWQFPYVSVNPIHFLPLLSCAVCKIAINCPAL